MGELVWRGNILATLLLVAALLTTGTSAATYNVGDTMGWMVPPGGAVAYATWAAQHNFTVGDILVFDFTTGSHTVAKVTSDAFASCNGANAISLRTNGPSNFTLDAVDEDYFICTTSNHCSSGMRLQVNVSSSGNGSPRSSPPGSPPTTPSGGTTTSPPPPSSTPPTAVTTFSLIFMSIAVTLLCYNN